MLDKDAYWLHSDITGKNIVIIPLGDIYKSFCNESSNSQKYIRQQLISHIPQPINPRSSTKDYENGYKQMVVLFVEECRNEQVINKKLNHLSNKFSRWGRHTNDAHLLLFDSRLLMAAALCLVESFRSPYMPSCIDPR
jgi:hypothetical protein